MSDAQSNPFEFNNSVVLSDSEMFLESCAERGLNTQTLSAVERLPECSLVFSFSDDAARRTFVLARNSSKSRRCIFCPVQVFDGRVCSALYGLELMFISDIGKALESQRKYLKMLNAGGVFVLQGFNAFASVRVNEAAMPYALISEDVCGGFVHSVAEFFEVHDAHMRPHDACPFVVEGTLHVSGLLMVLRKSGVRFPEGTERKLVCLAREVASHQARLTVKNNCVTSFVVCNCDYVELLKRAGGARGLSLTEFAIGVNDAIASSINFSVNSQLNEGVGGVHVALGDGSTGYHIDFLSPGTRVTPQRYDGCR